LLSRLKTLLIKIDICISDCISLIRVVVSKGMQLQFCLCWHMAFQGVHDGGCFEPQKAAVHA
jgi:hypothetical protein